MHAPLHAPLRLVTLLALVPALAAQEPADPIPGWIADLNQPQSEAGRQACAALLGVGDAAVPAMVRALNEALPQRTERGIHGGPGFQLVNLGNELAPADITQHALATFEPRAGSVIDLSAEHGAPGEHWLFWEHRGLSAVDCRVLGCLIVLEPLGDGAVAALPTLLKFLDDPRREVAEQATRVLAGLGPVAVRPLADLLGDRRRGWAAATALAAIGAEGERALAEEFADDRRPTRMRALFGIGLAAEHTDDETWRSVAEVLAESNPTMTRLAAWSISRGGERTVPLLIELLDDSESVRGRGQATAALGLIGPAAKAAAPRLILQLEQESMALGQWSAEALGRIRPDGEVGRQAVQALVNAAAITSWHARTACFEALSSFGELARPALPMLRRGLQSNGLFEKWTCANVLRRLGPVAQQAWPEMLTLLGDPILLVRQEAVRVASQMGAEGARALAPHLDDPELGYSVEEALVEIGTPALESLVATVVTSGSERARQGAARALGQIGDPGTGAELAALLRGNELPARRRAAAALCQPELARLAGPQAAPALEESLASADLELRAAAICALTLLPHTEPVERSVIAQLVEDARAALSAESTEQRLAGVAAVQCLGPAANAAVPDLFERLRDEHRQVRGAAAHAIGAIRPEVLTACATLFELVQDRNVRVAPAPPKPDATVEELRRRLQDDDPAVVGASIRALCAVAADDPEALLDVIAALRHPQSQVRDAAREGLTAWLRRP